VKVIRPFAVDDTTLVSSNVAETDPAYAAGTTYALGAIVRSDATHRRYQSLQAGNTGRALDNVAWWLDIGPTNRWAMFDQTVGTQTSAASIVTVVSMPRRVNSIALLNIVATSVRVQITTAAAGTIYDRTFSLRDNTGVNSWYAYLYNPIKQMANLIVQDLPIDYAPTITVTIASTGGTAAVGSLILGYATKIGAGMYSPTIGIVDYSRKTADEFGNYQLVKRPFSRSNSFKIWCDNVDLDAIVDLLSDLRATPCVWVLTYENGAAVAASTTVFGFYKDWSIDVPYLNHSICNLQIEGLT